MFGGLRTRLLFVLMAVLGAMILLVSVFMLGLTRRSVEVQSLRHAEAMGRVLAAVVAGQGDGDAEPISDADLLPWAERLGARSVHVWDDRGALVAGWPDRASSTDGGPPALGESEIVSAIGSRDGEPVAIVHARVLRGSATLRIRMEVGLAGAMGLVRTSQQLSVLYVVLDVILMGIVAWVLLTRAVVRPISRISAATARVAGGDLVGQLEIGGGGEIADLARDFNSMVDRIRRGREALEARLAELAEANRRLATAQDEVMRSERLATVGQLAAGVAHEIGNPLASVMGFAELLRDREGLSKAEVDDLVRRVEEELQRIHRIIRELLDYSRAEPRARVPLDVRVPARAAASLASHHPKARALRIVDLMSGELPPALGDEARLTQLFLNLLLNAADATGGAGTVVLTSRSVGEGSEKSIEVAVSDDGPGVAPGDLRRIFQPFFTTKAPGEGTGLGLAMCERIASELDGSLRVESTAGSGAVFVLRIPATEARPGSTP